MGQYWNDSAHKLGNAVKVLCKHCGKREINRDRSKSSCTVCLDKKAVYMNNYYHKNSEKILPKQKGYYILNRETIKDRTKKSSPVRVLKLLSMGLCVVCGKNPINIERSKRRCSGCLDIELKERKRTYPERKKKIQAIQKRCAEKNPEPYQHYRKIINYKRRNATGYHTLGEWKRVLKESNHRCLSCGATQKIERDHVVPIAQGGTNDIKNIQPLCKTCNSKKGKKIIDFRPFGNWILEWT